MKKILLFAFLLLTLVSYSQKKFDSKIIATLNDSVGLYEKVRIALINNEFIVKDNHNKDTLSTYVREISGVGYVLIRAIISGNSVTLAGVYGKKKLDIWGYTGSPKDYENIIYYKGSKTWKILFKIGSSIAGEMTFSK